VEGPDLLLARVTLKINELHLVYHKTWLRT
jgi:hypothetical protein